MPMRGRIAGAIASRRTRSSRTVEEGAAHRIALANVALAHRDLEQMGARIARAEHLGAGPEIGAPLAAEGLVEASRVERMDRRPVLLEALGPAVQGERVMAAQILHVDHFQAALLHGIDRFGEAGDPAAGKDVLADVEIGVKDADMADE